MASTDPAHEENAMPIESTAHAARFAARLRPLALALACASGADPVTAAVIWPVTHCNDAGAGSLRAAFASAADGDQVDLTGLTCGTISLTTGALVNSRPGTVEVRGSLDGNDQPTLTIKGNHGDRIFSKTSGGLGLYSLAITAGAFNGAGGGGCIATQGGLRLDDSVVSDCSVSTTGITKAIGGAIFAGGGVYMHRSSVIASSAHATGADSIGGAISSSGNIELQASTISGNSVTGDGSHFARGGGIYAGRFFTSEYSTIADNRAEQGGGVFVFGGGSNRILLDNSTISGNEASSWAGGLMVAAAPLSLTFRSSTIAANRAPTGSFGGVYLTGTATLNSTIIANNSQGNGLQASDLGGATGTTVAGANNLILASSLAVPSGTLALDPKLGPLQDNGGATWTHALLTGSPAIDHGSNIGNRTRDQRMADVHHGDGPTVTHDFPRVVGMAADIGAFEYGADRIFASGFE
jgi:hypothetical protein